jgi:ribose transport system permease protein
MQKVETISSERSAKFFRAILDNIGWLILVVCIIVFSSTIDGYSSAQNYINIIHHSVFIGILAIAECFCLISGKIDLSIESIAAFSAIFSAWLCGTSTFASGYLVNPFVGLLIVIIAGTLIGLFNALLIVKLRIDAFLVTLSTYLIFRGVATFVTGGKGVAGIPDSFRMIDTIRPANIPLVVILMFILYIIFQTILTNTKYGKHLFIIGGNESAAYNFGINVSKVIFITFVVSGALSAVSGWLIVARASGATPAIAQGYLFEVLAAVVIGGVSLQGGVGSLVGVFAGVLILGSIHTALNLLAISPFLTEIIRGLLVLVAILLDNIKKRFR